MAQPSQTMFYRIGDNAQNLRDTVFGSLLQEIGDRDPMDVNACSNDEYRMYVGLRHLSECSTCLSTRKACSKFPEEIKLKELLQEAEAAFLRRGRSADDNIDTFSKSSETDHDVLDNSETDHDVLDDFDLGKLSAILSKSGDLTKIPDEDKKGLIKEFDKAYGEVAKSNQEAAEQLAEAQKALAKAKRRGKGKKKAKRAVEEAEEAVKAARKTNDEFVQEMSLGFTLLSQFAPRQCDKCKEREAQLKRGKCKYCRKK